MSNYIYTRIECMIRPYLKKSNTTFNMGKNSNSQSLHICNAFKLRAILNKIYTLINLLSIAAILYYRVTFFMNKTYAIPWLILFIAELFLSFIWLLEQPLYWWPVTRTVYPDRLPKDEELPGIDVFICTADHVKEPTFDVMNTVISAMTLDYPAKKLSVYLSDDGGATVTLEGLKEAWIFATWWLPFCRKYNVKTICPKAYFEEANEGSHGKELLEDKRILKGKYEHFKNEVRTIVIKGQANNARDHPALVKVVDGNSIKGDATAAMNPEQIELPLLVYVAREKRPSNPHHFKAGALNVLLRVSSTLSNSPCILVLDCDMYCNDSISARQAMCFHLDDKISPSLGWVQYAHKFYNISESDVYDSQMRSCWEVLFPGMDGLQGPVLSGTNFFIKRKALFCGLSVEFGNDVKELRSSFGPSNEIVKSLSQIDKPCGIERREISSVQLQEAQFVASCTYENGTKWGEQVGFLYESVVEDVMTGLRLHSQGWVSVFLNPTRPQFLGAATTNLDTQLFQNTRWNAGLLQIGLSKYCPLIYTPSKTDICQRMIYTWVGLYTLEFFPVLCFAVIPPVCFFYGIPLYPEAMDPFLIAFAFAFIASVLKHLLGVLIITRGSVSAWLNAERISLVKAVTSYVYGTLDCVMSKLGIREASFIPTNKAEDDDATKWYKMGKYDFRTSDMFLVPLVTLVTLNLTCFVGGLTRMVVVQNWNTLLAQGLLSSYALFMSLPVIEGMIWRKDNARIPLATTLKSILLSTFVLSLGYFIFLN